MQPLAAGVQYRSTLFNSRYSRGLQYVLVVIPSCGALDLLSPSASPGPIGPHYSMSGTVPVLKDLLAPAKKCWNIKNRSNPQTTSYIITRSTDRNIMETPVPSSPAAESLGAVAPAPAFHIRYERRPCDE